MLSNTLKIKNPFFTKDRPPGFTMAHIWLLHWPYMVLFRDHIRPVQKPYMSHSETGRAVLGEKRILNF